MDDDKTTTILASALALAVVAGSLVLIVRPL